MSEISAAFSRNKDGTCLLGGYSIYIGQLITTMTTNKDDMKWTTIFTQVLMFVALILMREYKKKSNNMNDVDTMTEGDLSEDILRRHNIVNEQTSVQHPIRDFQSEQVQQREQRNVVNSTPFQHQIHREERISQNHRPFSPMATRSPF